MNTQTLRSIFISSALLLGTAGSYAATPDSAVESLVKATLSGQNMVYDRSATSMPVSSAPDAAVITRQVLRGESTAIAREARGVQPTTALAEPTARYGDSWRLAQQFLLGHAG